MADQEELCLQIRDVLQAALKRFVDNPFDDMREGDAQASIFSALRSRVSPTDTDLILNHLRPGKHSYPGPLRTARVHREMKLDDEWKLDIAVFRNDRPVEMSVHWNGPLDILAGIRGGDLAAVVEVKAAPSKNMWGAYRDDLAKLAAITDAYPECQGFFVVFDKSLQLGGATSSSGPSYRWLDGLDDNGSGRIEAHYVDRYGCPSHRRGVLTSD